jgi:hypothetical protein
VWRLLTCFLFVGRFSMSFVVNLLWMCAALRCYRRALAHRQPSRHGSRSALCAPR